MSFRVLIVGAGPVGLTLALELSRYGVPVRIIDQAAEPTRHSKALVVWSRTLELLQRSGCADRFVRAGLRAASATIIAGDETIGHVHFDHVETPFPFGLMIPQSETERLLAERLHEFGITVERPVQLVALKEEGDTVRATLRHGDGREEATSVEWLAGCDGAHSTVRHQLGLRFEGDTLQSRWILADVHATGFATADPQVLLYWHEDGLLAIFPIAPGRYRIVADAPGPEGDPSLDEVRAVVARRGPRSLELSDPVWLSAFHINERQVSSFRTHRCFLAGDAAHVHSPAGGQGMNTGMQDAFNLAWKLALVCHREVRNPALLDSYSPERSAIATQVITAAGRLTAVGTLHGRARQTLRNLGGHLALGLAPIRRSFAAEMTEVSVGYPKSPANGPRARGISGPTPGMRAPLVAGTPPVGAGSTPRFALCAAEDAAARSVLARFPALLETELRAPFADGGAWLVRPDGYVAGVARAGSYAGLSRYLDDLKAEHP